MAPPLLDFDACRLSRLQSGYFFKTPRVEKIGIYDTTVWQIDKMSLCWKSRSEHLHAAKKQLDPANYQKFVVANPDGDEASDKPADNSDEESSRRLAEDMKKFTPSLQPPSHTLDQNDVFGCGMRDDYVHLGRPMMQDKASRDVKAIVWMHSSSETFPSIQSPEFPLKLENIRPLLDLLGMGSQTHVDALKEFFNARLPEGFPVQIELPLGVWPISAVVRFGNVEVGCKGDEGMFHIPGKADKYRAGEVIPSVVN
jgi:hypothetical protein